MIQRALMNLVPAGFGLQLPNGGGYDDIIWDEPDSPDVPTKQQVEDEIARLTVAIPLERLRAERDRRIAETDWWVLPDRTPTQEQLDYRQALRDITETYTSLDDVVWPTKPE